VGYKVHTKVALSHKGIRLLAAIRVLAERTMFSRGDFALTQAHSSSLVLSFKGSFRNMEGGEH